VKKPKQVGVRDQATIVLTLLDNGRMVIMSKNNGRTPCARMADAIVKMAAAVASAPALSPTQPAETSEKTEGNANV
jgi:hypothetical protein